MSVLISARPLTCSLASCHRRAPWPDTPRPRTAAGPPRTPAPRSPGWASPGGAWTARHSWRPAGRSGGSENKQASTDLGLPVTNLLAEVEGEAGRAPDGGQADGPGCPGPVTPHHVPAVA